jgi:hypothetical protein
LLYKYVNEKPSNNARKTDHNTFIVDDHSPIEKPALPIARKARPNTSTIGLMITVYINAITTISNSDFFGNDVKE